MARLAAVAAVLLAAFTAWLSQGTIGFTGAEGLRIGVLPLSVGAASLAACAGAALAGLWWSGASLLPALLLIALLLPWAPLPVPSAALLWVHPLSWLIWAAVLVLMVRSLPWRGTPGAVFARAPRRAAATLAALIFALSAWRAAPMIPGGDEPHYLIITQSLLIDRALTIEDVHRRRDYNAYFAGLLQPHVQRRGKDGRIYSVHAPGLPALIAPAFAIGGYRGVVAWLILLSAAGSALAWHVAWLATRRRDAAWFGWAAVTRPVTAIFQSFTVYPDGLGGVLTLTGLWALLRARDESQPWPEGGQTLVRPWLLHGAALAMLPWLHSRFAVLAGGLGALILLRLSSTRNPAAKAVAFLSVPTVSAVFWVGYFAAIYGRPSPSAAYGPGEMGSFSFVPGGLAGLLFDQRFGAVTYGPVLAVAFAGLGAMLTRPLFRRLALELLFVVLPYLLTVTHFAMWWGGWSPPARFFAAVLPLFALPAAAAWALAASRVSRLASVMALVLTACASALLVILDRGRMAFNTRDAAGLWLEWLGRLADLTAAAPMWSRDTDAPLFRVIAIWLAIVAGAYFLLRLIERRGRLAPSTVLPTLTGAMAMIAVMTATTIVWAAHDASGRTSSRSQLELLESASTMRSAIAVQLHPFALLPVANLPEQLRIDLTRPLPARPQGREPAPLFVVPGMPAGEYRLIPRSDNPRGWLMVGAARDPRDPFALQTLQLPVSEIRLTLPVALRTLVVRGEEEAWRSVSGLTIEPLSLTAPSERLAADAALRAVRYDGGVVYFMDGSSFPEPQAFWICGMREARVVVQPALPRQRVLLTLRNAPVDNRITLESGAWQQDLRMAPGEERRVEVPLQPGRAAALLRIAAGSGFRPSEADPASGDQRFLGVWVKLETE